MFRSPVVTILGHVDHGKTTLLDYIRQSRLTAREYGGITQRIGAYEIATGLKGYPTDKITFIDTPGHEAFSKLRARGANVADLALLLIDAKDSVMPQTVESIQHIKNANIPFIVVFNKVDLAEANVEKVKRDLLKYEIITEDKGGKVPAVAVSAKTGQGVDELLETILFTAFDLKLSYEKSNPGKAYVIETKKDRRGVVISVVMRDGEFRVGQTVSCGTIIFRIRSITGDRGQTLEAIIPSTSAELLGCPSLPEVGSLVTAEKKDMLRTQKETVVLSQSIPPKLEISDLLPKTEEKKLSLVVKADSQGSLEAILEALQKNQNLKIILSGIGDIHRSDIFLAKSTKAVVVGFAVSSDNEVRELAKQEKVLIKTYNIIYELIEELEEVADLLKEQKEKEKNLKGEATILATFLIEGERVYGAKVFKGKVNLGDNLEIYRNDQLVNKTRLVSLHIRAKKVTEVKKDQECGMVFSPALDIKVGDVVKSIS